MAVEGMQGSETVHVDVPSDRLWSMVSDVTRMGSWSPETYEAAWLDGASGPQVGARFKGRNKRGPFKWSTKCTVVAADPGKRFEFVVGTADKPVTRWRYSFAPSAGGTDVTESWQSERYGFFSKLLQKPAKATAALNEGIKKTLAKLKQAAESGAA